MKNGTKPALIYMVMIKNLYKKLLIGTSLYVKIYATKVDNDTVRAVPITVLAKEM